MKKTAGVLNDLSGRGFKFGIVVSRFNKDITQKLLDGSESKLQSSGVNEKSIRTFWVPGAFEIPLMLQSLAKTKKFDALIALGAVVRGETPHFDYVCEGVTSGIMKISLDYGIPIAFGILTTDNLRQATDRIGGRHGHKGEEAALVAIEMAQLLKKNK